MHLRLGAALALGIAASAAAPTPTPPFTQTQAVPSAQAQNLNRSLSLQPLPAALESPAPGGSPVTVFASLSMNKVAPIDVLGASTFMDFYCLLAWRDDRYEAWALAGEPVPFAGSGWFAPAPEIINLVSGLAVDALAAEAWSWKARVGMPPWLRGDEAAAAEPGNATWLVGSARAHATLAVHVDLREFPFDAQNIQIFIEDVTAVSSIIIFRAAPTLVPGLVPVGESWLTAIDGWSINSLGAATEDSYYAAFDETYSRLATSTRVQRQGSYWTTRIVLGVALFELMAIWTQALASSEPARQVVTITCFLGMVSWEFVLVLSMPPLGYNTRIDDFMTMSFLVVFVFYSVQSLHLALTAAEGAAPATSHAQGSGGSSGSGGGGGGQLLSPRCHDCARALADVVRRYACCCCFRQRPSTTSAFETAEEEVSISPSTRLPQAAAAARSGGARLAAAAAAVGPAASAAASSLQKLLAPLPAPASTHRTINAAICFAFTVIYAVSSAVCFLAPRDSFYSINNL